MSLSASQLDAFMAVVQAGTFSAAAKNSHITQSALSQRILNLEQDLKTRLLIRDRKGIRLTPAGQQLLRFCQIKNQLEDEFLSDFQRGKTSSELFGVVRIAAYSSVSRSLVLPALAPFFKTNPNLQLEFATQEMRDLPSLLESAEVDFILLDHDLKRTDIESIEVGVEEYVLVKPSNSDTQPQFFLDHDSDDQTTRRFIKSLASKESKIQRRYLDDVYGLIDGVKLGLGQAILPRHLITGTKGLTISKPERSMKLPIFLHYMRQPYSTALHRAIVTCLTTGIPKELERRSPQ
ncbi:MAG: LysR family transcriptional regulator [Bdellovibrionales bacterium]|nr:LysR family transcriptional regulator [Bdellovibrionales bacterium]